MCPAVFALGLGLVVFVFYEAVRVRVRVDDYDYSSAAIVTAIPVKVKEKPLLRTKTTEYLRRKILSQDGVDVAVAVAVDDDAQHPRQLFYSSWHQQQQGEERVLENESEKEPSVVPSSNISSSSYSDSSIDTDPTPPGLRLPWWGWLLASIGILFAVAFCVLVGPWLPICLATYVNKNGWLLCFCCPCALLIFPINAFCMWLLTNVDNDEHERVHNTDTSNTTTRTTTTTTTTTTTAPAPAAISEEKSFSQTWMQQLQQEEKGTRHNRNRDEVPYVNVHVSLDSSRMHH